MSSSLRRAWLLVNIAITVALLPALFPGGGGGSATAVAAGSAELVNSPTATIAVPSTTTLLTTTTSSPPTTAAPPVTVKAAAVRTVRKTTTTTAKPRPKRAATTTTTAAPERQAAAAPPPASGSESGKATWYDYKPGICAHKTLPFGTVVTVHAVNGKSVQCTVGDRGPYVDGYVIDLNQREFEQLAPTSAGRIDCTITW